MDPQSRNPWNRPSTEDDAVSHEEPTPEEVSDLKFVGRRMVHGAVAIWTVGYSLLAIIDWLPPRMSNIIKDGMGLMCLVSAFGGTVWLIGHKRVKPG